MDKPVPSKRLNLSTEQVQEVNQTPRSSLSASSSLEKYRIKYQEIKRKANYLSLADDKLLQQFLGLMPVDGETNEKEIKIRFYQAPEPVETTNKKTGQKENEEIF